MKERERRHGPRVARAFMVRYRLPLAGQGSWQLSPLRDFSSEGARFISEHPFQIGDRLDVQLLLPSSRDPIALSVRIAWTRPAQFGTIELGVAFDLRDPIVKQSIDNAAAYFLRRKDPSG